jgi:hypothetical protein
MRPDPIVEDIRKYREAKAAEYGYDPDVALKDFMRLHEKLMTVRGLSPAFPLQAVTRPALRRKPTRVSA